MSYDTTVLIGQTVPIPCLPRIKFLVLSIEDGDVTLTVTIEVGWVIGATDTS